MGVRLLRFDMSEYMERHTVSRLIGAPPGYVGFDQGGLLTDGVDQTPHCVLLLDEIEKAHPDLFNILLQVMDHGKLTDHNGKQVDFRNVILIMTTNAGASEMAKAAIGFGNSRRTGDDEEAIKRMFTPEFRNRLDAIDRLRLSAAGGRARVVDKFVLQLELQLADRSVTFELDEKATAWLAERGYDKRMGARPLGRLIQEKIKQPLAEEVLFGKLQKGGEVKVSVEEKPDGEHRPEARIDPRRERQRKEKPLRSKEEDGGRAEAEEPAAEGRRVGAARAAEGLNGSRPAECLLRRASWPDPRGPAPAASRHARPGDGLFRLARADARAAAAAGRARRRRPRPGAVAATTEVVGSVADRALVRATMRDYGVEAVVHAGALHKPNIETHPASDFVAVNVQGTLNLLEEAVAPGSQVDRFVFTSTTSLMISKDDPRRALARRREGGLDHRGDGAAAAAQHLRRHEALRRASLPDVPRDARPADAHPPHRAVLPGGGRHGARDRPVGRRTPRSTSCSSAG